MRQGVWRGYMVAVLAAVPVLYYVGTVVQYAYNFPYMDDYPTVVGFINRLPEAGTFGQKVALLMEQNNFHRLVLVKGLAWLNVVLTGSVNFVFLQYVGLGLLLLTAWLLAKSYAQQSTTQWLGFLPALYLLFQFQGWNVAFWAIVAISNVGAPALALLAFYLANRGREAWAMAVGLVALFTNGNGILVLPLLVAGWALQQRWRWVAGTLLVTLPALLFYFQHYENPAGRHSAGPSIGNLLGKLPHLLALDTAFLGALLYHPAVPWLPILLGSFTLGWTGYLLLIRYDRTNPPLFWLLVFLHLSGLMLAVNRIQNDTSIVFASRYRNITALHVAVTYLTIAEVWRLRRVRGQAWFTGAALLGTFGVWAVSNWTYHSKIVRFRELKQTDNLLWLKYGQVRGCAPSYDPVKQLGVMAERQTFRPDEATNSFAALPSEAVSLVPTSTPGDTLQYGLDINELHNDGYYVVSGWAKVAGRKANFNDTFVGIKTAEKGWQYYTTLFHQRLDKEDSANDKDTGFTAIISAKTAPDSLAIFVRSGRYGTSKVWKVGTAR